MKFNNRQAIRGLREEIQRALSKSEFGLEVQRLFGNGNFVVEVGKASYDPDGSNITFKLSFATKDAATGAVMDKEATAFKSGARLFCLDPDWLGRCFTFQGDSYKIEGLAPRSYKFPVVCRKVSNGKGVKFPVETVIAEMSKRQMLATDKVFNPPPKRPDAEILEDFRRVENELSPENLTCDGELPRNVWQQKRTVLVNQRVALVRELGREPTKEELYPEIF